MTVVAPAATGELSDLATTVRRHLGAAVSNMVVVGQALRRGKELLPHGQFGAWLEEIGLDQRTAQRMMTAAIRFAHRPDTVTHLPTGLVYELAAPSTPEEVVEAVIARQLPATLDAVRAAKQQCSGRRPRQTRQPRAAAVQLLELGDALLEADEPADLLADALWEFHEEPLVLIDSLVAILDEARSFIEKELERDQHG